MSITMDAQSTLDAAHETEPVARGIVTERSARGERRFVGGPIVDTFFAAFPDVGIRLSVTSDAAFATLPGLHCVW